MIIQIFEEAPALWHTHYPFLHGILLKPKNLDLFFTPLVQLHSKKISKNINMLDTLRQNVHIQLIPKNLNFFRFLAYCVNYLPFLYIPLAFFNSSPPLKKSYISNISCIKTSSPHHIYFAILHMR